jgi:hypothetical protein
MLLYSGSRLMPVVFASAVAITSKTLLRVRLQNGSRHFLNPSNFGISAALLLFPWVGIAPPYHFTENIHGWGSWILPGIIVLSGSFLNIKFTRRICVAVGWVGGFAAQALLRNLVFGHRSRHHAMHRARPAALWHAGERNLWAPGRHAYCLRVLLRTHAGVSGARNDLVCPAISGGKIAARRRRKSYRRICARDGLIAGRYELTMALTKKQFLPLMNTDRNRIIG